MTSEHLAAGVAGGAVVYMLHVLGVPLLEYVPLLAGVGIVLYYAGN